MFCLGLPLLPPLSAAAEPESNLPACCRRDGKHQCAMRAKALAERGPGFHAAKAFCSEYRLGESLPVAERSVILPGGLLMPRPVLPASPLPERREILSRIGQGRSAQKRGPPAPLSV